MFLYISNQKQELLFRYYLKKAAEKYQTASIYILFIGVLDYSFPANGAGVVYVLVLKSLSTM